MSVDKDINRIDDTLTKLLLERETDPALHLEGLLKALELQLEEVMNAGIDEWLDRSFRVLGLEEISRRFLNAGTNIMYNLGKFPIKAGGKLMEVLVNLPLVPLILLNETATQYYGHVHSKFGNRMDKITELRKVIRQERKELSQNSKEL